MTDLSFTLPAENGGGSYTVSLELRSRALPDGVSVEVRTRQTLNIALLYIYAHFIAQICNCRDGEDGCDSALIDYLRVWSKTKN